jgi:O-antigen/teichoic acid export membrane protein
MIIDVKAKSQKLIANSLTLLFGNVGSAILSFLLSILIGRVTGETGLGAYAAALAWVFPLSLIAEFGLGTLITREVAQFPEKTYAYLHSVTQARLLIGGSLLLLLWLCAPLLSQDLAVVHGIRIAAPLVIILPFYSTFTAIFRAYQQMHYVAFLNTGMLISQVILTALIFANTGGIQAALLINTLTSTGQLIAAWGVFRWRFDISSQLILTPNPEQSSQGAALLHPTSNLSPLQGGVPTPNLSPLQGGVPTPNPSPLHREGNATPPLYEVERGAGGEDKLRFLILLQQSYPFAIAAILAAVQMRLNILLLENISGAAVVGYYVAAQRFLDAGRLLPMALFDALFPMLASLASQREKLNRIFLRVSLGLLGYGLCFGMVFSVFATWIIVLTYGSVFSPSALVLQVAAWSLLPLVLKQARTLYWYALKREQFVNRVTLFSLGLQLLLALWLIPLLGAAGAALVLLLIETIAMMWLWCSPMPHLSEM